jgi:aryl-alcohol dehydrogenase-like predicted oxidoreductase
MELLQLFEGEPRTSSIGFGCASIMGRVSGRKSRCAIELALDQGINYFDVARSYGWGQAESALGRMLRGKRDKVFIASKCGILPPSRGRLFAFAKPIIRPIIGGLRSLAPTTHRKLLREAGRMAVAHKFDSTSSQLSLDQTLRELRTEYLDLLLLHGCPPEVSYSAELFDFLEECVASGKIRRYGVAADIEAVTRVARTRAGVRAVQIANNPAANAITKWTHIPGVAVITHSPFGRGGVAQSLSRFIASNHVLGAQWSARVNIDLASTRGIYEFLLCFSLASNRAGVVVCGMHLPEHIRSNAQIARRSLDTEAFHEVASEMRVQGAFMHLNT